MKNGSNKTMSSPTEQMEAISGEASQQEVWHWRGNPLTRLESPRFLSVGFLKDNVYQNNPQTTGELKAAMTKRRVFESWASEGFFPEGGHWRIFPKFFQGGAKSGEICFFPTQNQENNLFCKKFQNPGGGQGPLADAHGSSDWQFCTCASLPPTPRFPFVNIFQTEHDFYCKATKTTETLRAPRRTKTWVQRVAWNFVDVDKI